MGYRRCISRRHQCHTVTFVINTVTHVRYAAGMELSIAVPLYYRVAHACVCHNGGTTAGFVSIAIGTVTAALGIKGMRCAKLVAHFVGYIINVKRVAHRRSGTGHGTCLKIRTWCPRGKPATRCAEAVPDVKIFCTYGGVYYIVTLVKEFAGIVVVYRVAFYKHHFVFVSYQLHRNRKIPFKHAVYTCYGGSNSRYYSLFLLCQRSALQPGFRNMECRIFYRSQYGSAVGAPVAGIHRCGKGLLYFACAKTACTVV